MAVQERLSFDAANEHSLIACEHRHRYQMAAELCRDLRVLDLACGSGYGSTILAATAKSVHGVDNDVATVDLAAATVEKGTKATFSVADALAVLAGADLAADYDAIVCFEALEHLDGLDNALEALSRHAADGMRLVMSVPNSGAFGEVNEYHRTQFDYDAMVELCGKFKDPIVVCQYLAEGSVIVAEGASEYDAVLERLEDAEAEYANHYIVTVNFPAQVVRDAHRGRAHLAQAPNYNRYMLALETANAELRRRNTELARKMMRGSQASDARVGSGAVGFVATLEALETEVAQQQEMILAQRRELLQLRQEIIRLS